MITILKKELLSYFHSWRGYIFLAISIFFTGALSFIFNFSYGSARVELLVSYLSLALAILSPAVFANCFSKEEDQKTEKLLFSLPFEVTDIVFGKYLAALCLFGINICFLIILPIIFGIFTKVNILSAYSAVLGLTLLCSAFLSILFFIASALRKKAQVLITSYATIIICVALSIIPTVRSSQLLYVLTSFAHRLAFFARLDNFIRGRFDIEAIIYYLSVTVIFLLLTLKNIEKRRIEVLSGGAL